MKLVLLSALLLASPVFAQTEPSSVATNDPASAAATPDGVTAAPAKPKKPRKICRREANSASRLGSSVCKTAAEWADADSKATTQPRVNQQ